jgi:tetratricopeptide (TPR) repeat protein
MVDSKQTTLNTAQQLLTSGNIAGFVECITELYNLTCNCFLAEQPKSVWTLMLSKLDGLEDNEQDYNLNFAKGFLLLRNSEYNKAYLYLTNAIKQQPLSSTLYNLRSYIPIKENSNRLNDANEAVLLHPSAKNYFTVASIIKDEAGASAGGYFIRPHSPESDRIHKINTEKALMLYERVITLNPEFECAYANKASMHLRLDETDQAAVLYEKCLRLNPNHWCWTPLWRCYKELNDKNRYLSIILYIEELIKLHPDEPAWYLELTFAYEGLENYQKAIECHSIYLSRASGAARDGQRQTDIKTTLSSGLKDALYCFNIFLQDHNFEYLYEVETYLKTLLKSHDPNIVLDENSLIYQELDRLKTVYLEKISYSVPSCVLKHKDNPEPTEDEVNANKLMKYLPNYKIGFGNYAGNTIKEILEKDPHYLLWCIVNLHHFAIGNSLLMNKGFIEDELYLKAIEINLIKTKLVEDWTPEQDEDRDYGGYNDNDYDRDTFDALTDGQLGDWDDFGGDIDDARAWSGRD